MPANLSNFENYLEGLSFRFSVPGFSETWLNDTSANIYNLTGFNHVSNRRRGGVPSFIKTHIKYISRSDLDINNDDMESVFVELIKDGILGCKTNIIVGVIYRPPQKNIVIFTEHINNILSTLKPENKSIYILGDFNIDLFNSESHIDSSEFFETMFSYSQFPLINRPTRITQKSATLIDNIYSNNLNVDCLNGIFLQI